MIRSRLDYRAAQRAGRFDLPRVGRFYSGCILASVVVFVVCRALGYG